MKKFLCMCLLALLFAGCSARESENVKSEDFSILTLFSSPSKTKDRVWVGTFQLAFNDMKNNILKQNIIFAGEKPTPDLIGLNNEEFRADMLNPSSYYTSYGLTKISEKEKIKKALKEKFNTESDVIDKLNWSERSGSYYAYAMIKKDFEFLKEFDKLGKFNFNNSGEKYEYFGADQKTDDTIRDNIRVLFYNSENDYAVQLYTKSNDIVYLYRTDSGETFETIYKQMLEKEKKYNGKKYFQSEDNLKIPNLKFSKTREYEELCNKRIENTGLMFSAALETIEMELDSKGGKVKSEAVIMTENAVSVEQVKPRYFNFDKTFTIFLVDKDKKDPYLALQIEDLKKFTK